MRGSSTGSDGPADAAAVRLVGVVALGGLLLLGAASAVVLAPGLVSDGDAPAPRLPSAGTPTDTGGDAGVDGGDGGADGDGGGDAGGGSGNDPDHVRPFTLVIGAVEECGRTCRDVTASLTNNGGNPRADVRVETEIRAGDDVVWEGNRPVGTLGSGETATHTERVELGLLDAAKVERNDGVVTVVTTVAWDGGSATYRERMQVA